MHKNEYKPLSQMGLVRQRMSYHEFFTSPLIDIKYLCFSLLILNLKVKATVLQIQA